MLPASTDVLIVGAGPAGLACAISLVTHGVKNIVIVDAQERAQSVSRAIVIHAQTVEDLDSIGCADPLTARGLHADYMTVRAQTKVLAQANFTSLAPHTRFPYALLISQSETETILEDRLKALGVNVLRPYRVSAIAFANAGATVTFESGESITTRKLVGADGTRSTVRTLASIPFRDPDTNRDPHADPPPVPENDDPKYGRPLIIADVHLAGPIPPSITPRDLATFLGPLGFLLLVPLPPAPDDPAARPIYRLSCPAEPGASKVSLARLQAVVSAALGLPPADTPTVDTILWSSRFRVRSAVADAFVARRAGATVLLVGDAAHVHSPAGGQGMNLGLRDAIALGRALAQDGDLAAFSRERRKLALDVIKMTKVMTWATGLKSTPARKARNSVWWLMGRTSLVNNKLALRLSGLTVAKS